MQFKDNTLILLGFLLVKKRFFTTFALPNGPVAEWLGRALQKLVQRFESARDLTDALNALAFRAFYFFYKTTKGTLRLKKCLFLAVFLTSEYGK